MNFTAPIKLCDLEFSERGLPATMQSGMVWVLPTATSDQVAAVRDYLAIAVPCTHVFVSEPQKCASDEWVAKNAALAALPGVADLDPFAEVRARLTSELDALLFKVNNLGGLV